MRRDYIESPRAVDPAPDGWWRVRPKNVSAQLITSLLGSPGQGGQPGALSQQSGASPSYPMSQMTPNPGLWFVPQNSGVPSTPSGNLPIQNGVAGLVNPPLTPAQPQVRSAVNWTAVTPTMPSEPSWNYAMQPTGPQPSSLQTYLANLTSLLGGSGNPSDVVDHNITNPGWVGTPIKSSAPAYGLQSGQPGTTGIPAIFSYGGPGSPFGQ